MNIVSKTHERAAQIFETFIYGGRWVLAPMCVGLLAVLFIYALRFLMELYHLCVNGLSMASETLMTLALSMIDSVMLGSLIYLILIGSYSVFIRKPDFPQHNRPQILERITSGLLKIKMSTSIIGVSVVHLVKTFIDLASMPTELLIKQCALHLVFIVSGIGVAFIEKLSHETPSNSSNH